MKPTFTLTYGLGWTLEMPPVEKDGKQVEFVNRLTSRLTSRTTWGLASVPRCWARYIIRTLASPWWATLATG